MRELIIDGEEIVLDDSGNLVSRKAVVEPQVDSAKGTSGDVPFISPMGITFGSAEEAAIDRSGTLDMAKGLCVRSYVKDLICNFYFLSLIYKKLLETLGI